MMRWEAMKLPEGGREFIKRMRPPVFDGKGTLSCVEITRSRVDDGQDLNPHRTDLAPEQRMGGHLGRAFAWRCRSRWL